MVKMENDMKIETQGYGSSMIATKYVYERINDIIENEKNMPCGGSGRDQMLSELKELQKELAHNYQVDTKEKITD
tara:strand:- start:206 stop:430 length:225 start_codon:yes stop_codon:yes gene_type:complete